MIKNILLLAIFIFSAVGPGLAADPLIAIDILLEPDDGMLTQSKADNARLRENYPEGFALDVGHTTHISVVQCYVHTQDLDKVFAAVKQVSDAQDPVGMELKTTGYFSASWQGLGLAGITAAPTPQLLKYQETILAAIMPFAAKNGTLAAFAPNEDGSRADKTIAAYVNSFTSRSIGKHYNPHVTIGLCREDFAKEMIAAPYTSFSFKIKSVGVYQLGDFGAARKKLWTSTISKLSQDGSDGDH